MEIPDHPIIRNMERFGTPDGKPEIKPKEYDDLGNEIVNYELTERIFGIIVDSSQLSNNALDVFNLIMGYDRQIRERGKDSLGGKITDQETLFKINGCVFQSENLDEMANNLLEWVDIYQ